MKVVITPEAQDDLTSIWKWNANERGIHHANSYLQFLGKHIDALSKKYLKGKTVENRSDLRFILIQRRPGGYGHIAVYSVINNEIVVAHIFHTSQNWQAEREG